VVSLNSYEAGEGFTDDLVMSLVNFSYFTGRDLFEDLSSHNIGRKLFQNCVVDAEQEMMPLPVITDGIEDYDSMTLH